MYNTKQASQHSISCTATDRGTEYTALAGLLRTERTNFTKISIFSQHFLPRSFFSLVKVSRFHKHVHQKHHNQNDIKVTKDITNIAFISIDQRRHQKNYNYLLRTSRQAKNTRLKNEKIRIDKNAL